VICGWTGKAAYEEWQQSPVRDKQLADLVGQIEVEANEHTFNSFHKVDPQ
jgi:carbamate kinase